MLPIKKNAQKGMRHAISYSFSPSLFPQISQEREKKTNVRYTCSPSQPMANTINLPIKNHAQKFLSKTQQKH
jgi:hypothetical protein